MLLYYIYYYKKIIIKNYTFFDKQKKLFCQNIKMVKFTAHELRVITEKRGIKNYNYMSREKLLSTVEESKCNFKNILQNGLKSIAKMQNLS